MNDMGQFTDTGWVSPAEPMPERGWLAAIALVRVGRRQSNASWQLGDLWAYGESRYGSRKALTEAAEWTGPPFQTCMNAAGVARRFEASRRREVLSFKHHAEVAALPPAEADALLDWAISTRASAKALRIRRNDEAAQESVSVGVPVADQVEAWLQARGQESGTTGWRLRRTAKVAPDLALQVICSGGRRSTLSVNRAYDISVERKRERERSLQTARVNRSVVGNSPPKINVVSLRTDPAETAALLGRAAAELRQVCDDNYSSETLRRAISQETANQIEADIRVALRFLSNLAKTWAMPELRALNATTARQQK